MTIANGEDRRLTASSARSSLRPPGIHEVSNEIPEFGPASMFVRDLFIKPELPRQVAALTLLVEVGQLKEWAGIYVLLASEAGSCMTGGIYAVTGGISLL